MITVKRFNREDVARRIRDELRQREQNGETRRLLGINDRTLLQRVKARPICNVCRRPTTQGATIYHNGTPRLILCRACLLEMTQVLHPSEGDHGSE